ncbi:MAG: XdhC family protein [Desulfobacteraceae bacterium]|nr:XdhC family protein [Desulfobacteraceae bacterium]
MSKFEKTVCQILDKGEPFVLATILSHEGSTPRTAGTKMIICPDGKIIGTIGGGLVEAEAVKEASEVFKTTEARIRTFNMTAATADSMDMICGGRLEVLLELIEPTPSNIRMFSKLAESLQKRQNVLFVCALPTEGKKNMKAERCLIMADGSPEGDLLFPATVSDPLVVNIVKQRTPAILTLGNTRFLVEPFFSPVTVYLFGAGHVSQQVSILAKMVDFRVVVLDDREEFANRERFKGADEIKSLVSFEKSFENLEIDQDSYIVIITRGHVHDRTVLEQALRTNAGYIGMIGSRRKRDAIYKALLNQGFGFDDTDRVHSPVGLEIGAETPQEIAVSIIAELIAVRAGS